MLGILSYLQCPQFSVTVEKAMEVYITKMKMEIIQLLHLLPLNWALAVNAECPFKLDYVRELPWDNSTYKLVIIEANCCQTLRSLLGVGFS